MKNIKFTEIEKIIIEKSTDISVTKKRLSQVLIFGLLSISGLIYLFVNEMYKVLLIGSILYMIITLFEKIGYGKAVISYKSVINKFHQAFTEE